MNLKFGWLVIKDSLCVSESENRMTSGLCFSPPPSPSASDGQAVRKRTVPLFRIHTCGRPYPCSHMDFTARYVSPLLGGRRVRAGNPPHLIWFRVSTRQFFREITSPDPISERRRRAIFIAHGMMMDLKHRRCDMILDFEIRCRSVRSLI